MLYTCRSFPDNLLRRYPIEKRGTGRRKKAGRDYLSCVCAFDIETTRLPEPYDDFSIMYIWQLQIGIDATIIGRNWHEFKVALDRLRDQMPEDVKLVCYVHNLAFEFQFLRGVFKFGPDDVFSIDSRRPLRVDLAGFIELRCSYIHSNMALETYLSKMGVEHKKTSLDYRKKRYPWTPLTDSELEYCVNDVRGLVEAVYKEMAHDGDDLYTIPLTSTGYVRRDVRKSMQRVAWKIVQPILPDVELYTLLREAFRGGNTHANRYYAKQHLYGVWSWDRSSSYPDVQMNRLFPVGRFMKREEPMHGTLYDDMNFLRKVRGKACIFRAAFTNIRLRDPQDGCPYISFDKCTQIGRITENGIEDDMQRDNGRILWADFIRITITDVDFMIIEKQYEWNHIEVTDLQYTSYGPLPEEIKRCIRLYYRLKTELKGDPEQDLLYMKSKNKLNSIYGMSAQNPVKDSLIFNGRTWEPEGLPLEELLEKSKKRAFFAYQWGVWTTCWARYELQSGIDLVTEQGGEFVYCDTDSVKYIGDVDWSEYNDARKRASEKSGAYATDAKGKRHYMGVYEREYDEPIEFATRGAKKYCYRGPDGHLVATVSGVTKREGGPDDDYISGGQELEARGGFDAFLQDVFVFEKAGGKELAYNDNFRKQIKVDGRRVMIRECVTIKPSTYALQDTDEYSALLEGLTEDELDAYMFDVFGEKNFSKNS